MKFFTLSCLLFCTSQSYAQSWKEVIIKSVIIKNALSKEDPSHRSGASSAPLAGPSGVVAPRRLSLEEQLSEKLLHDLGKRITVVLRELQLLGYNQRVTSIRQTDAIFADGDFIRGHLQSSEEKSLRWTSRLDDTNGLILEVDGVKLRAQLKSFSSAQERDSWLTKTFIQAFNRSAGRPKLDDDELDRIATRAQTALLVKN